MNILFVAAVSYQTLQNSTPIDPFTSLNDFDQNFYYPANQQTASSSSYSFAITRESQTISALDWVKFQANASDSVTNVQIPKITITSWSGTVKEFLFDINYTAMKISYHDRIGNAMPLD